MDDEPDSEPPKRADAAFDELLRCYGQLSPGADLSLLRRAYEYAAAKHHGQCRAERDAEGIPLPYITHPVAVAQILAELEMDLPSICAALLHDVVEDCDVSIGDIASEFGQEIASIVDGVTKLTQLELQEVFPDDTPLGGRSPENAGNLRRREETRKKAGNIRHLLVAMSKDLRVIVVKLADRLHNMRTLDAVEEAKRYRIAAETLTVFAPLAHRLGIWKLKSELEDLAFRHTMPEEYERIRNAVETTRADREGELEEAMQLLREKLQAAGITNATVTGRGKHLYSIYQKIQQQNLDISEIYDLVAVRVIVHTIPECYHVLAVVDSIWQPMTGMFADYIGQSKANLYQSLHQKVIGPRGHPMEVQIRTWDMHRTAEFGVAAHWAYKEKGEGGKADAEAERRLNWLREQITSWLSEAPDSRSFWRSVREDIFKDQVYVRTPRGDVKQLPAGSTPIDFAYYIHSDLGDHIVGARVNGRMVNLSYTLSNGDVVEIITRSNVSPSPDWLRLAKSARAKAKIRAFLRRRNEEQNIQRGREALQREAVRLGLDQNAFLKEADLTRIAKDLNLPSMQHLLGSIGYGSISVAAVVNRLKAAEPVEPRGLQVLPGIARPQAMRLTTVSHGNVSYRISPCCLPIPGDAILGYNTRARGLSIHRAECPNIQRHAEKEPERVTEVHMDESEQTWYSVWILIETADRKGLLADIGGSFVEQDTSILEVNTKSHDNGTATLKILAQVRGLRHLTRLIMHVRMVPDVLDIVRLGPVRVKSKS